MKHLVLIAFILCTVQTVYSSSWSMVNCENNDTARKCMKYINSIPKNEDIEFSVSNASRRHFSLDYKGNCSTFDQELFKLENCESCKSAFNRENKTECIEIQETQLEK